MESAAAAARRSPIPPSPNQISITRPFPRVKDRPHSVMVGSIQVGIFSVHNKGPDPVVLRAVRIASFGSLRGFHGLSLATAAEDLNSRRLDLLCNWVVRPNAKYRFRLLFSPKQVGYYQARILCDFSYLGQSSSVDFRVFLFISALGDDEISRSSEPKEPYKRPKRQWKRSSVIVPGVPPLTPSFVKKLKPYPFPAALRDQLKKNEVPEILRRGFSSETHSTYFDTLVFADEYQMEIDILAYSMQKETMRQTNEGFLALKVLGLAERRPSVIYRDAVYARSAGTSDKEYQGYVHKVSLDEVFLKFHSSFHELFIPKQTYDIRFSFSRTNLKRAHQALEASQTSGNLFTFPKAAASNTITPPSSSPKFRPINRQLNDEQMSAVAEIVAKNGAPPYIIFGPPGTGKTVTVIEAILQVRKFNPNSVILTCAPSNYASDLLLKRLIGEVEKRHILRLNAFTRSLIDVPSEIRDYCNPVSQCPTAEELKAFRVIVCTCFTAGVLFSQGIKQGHFTHIFLDEAGQGTEPEILVSIANLADSKTVVVLAGDHKQLGPVIRSPLALKFGLDKSLLERLISSPPYSAPFRKDLVTKLLRNYRSHPCILELPSKMFYDGELVPCAGPIAHSLIDWEYLPNKSFPMLFVGVEGRDEREGSSPSWFNPQEVSEVVEVVKKLREIRRNRVLAKDIGIITPYRQQVKKIKAALSKLKLEEITVGTVEQFQGQERRAIVISTVRSTRDKDPEAMTKLLSFDKQHNLGFLSNPKRFNVAVTRAQAVLVVIGNPQVLSQDYYWNELMLYCQKNNSWKGSPMIQGNRFDVETVESDDGLAAEDQAWPDAV